MAVVLPMFMKLHNTLYRWSGGKRFNMDGTLLLLISTGAKSGKTRTNPLVHLKIDGDTFVVAASNGGGQTHPNWYHNLVANPEVEVEFESQRFPVRARFTQEPERGELFDKFEQMNPRFTDYKGKTDRVIPVVVLEPRS